MQRNAHELSVRKSKRKTAGRAKNAQILEDAHDWAPKFEVLITNKDGTRLGAHQVLNWDATTYYIEADGSQQFRIVARHGQPRVSHAAMSRTSVAQIAPVIAADGTTVAIFVNIKADFDAAMSEEDKKKRKNPPPKSAGQVNVQLPVLVPGTRASGCPVYYLYSAHKSAKFIIDMATRA